MAWLRIRAAPEYFSSLPSSRADGQQRPVSYRIKVARLGEEEEEEESGGGESETMNESGSDGREVLREKEERGGSVSERSILRRAELFDQTDSVIIFFFYT